MSRPKSENLPKRLPRHGLRQDFELWKDLSQSQPFPGKQFQKTKLNPERGKNNTPRKVDMEHNDVGLEDDIPVQLGDFLGSMLIFRGVALHFQIYHVVLVKKKCWL